MGVETGRLSSKQLGINDAVNIIELADQKEIKALQSYRDATDSEERLNAKEDAYLFHLIQIRESRLMGKVAYDKEGVEAVIGTSYEDLELPEFEDYVII